MDRFRSIYELWWKIKALSQILDKREVYACLMLSCVAVSSYCLGKLTSVEAYKPKISIQMCDLSPKVISNEPKESAGNRLEAPPTTDRVKGLYIGSKSSDKYHLPECSGAKHISEANKIWFQSREEAQKAGYSPAGNCPGIEEFQ